MRKVKINGGFHIARVVKALKGDLEYIIQIFIQNS